MKLLAFSHGSGVTVAEVAFLLFVIAGIWIVAAWISPTQPGGVAKWRRMRMIVAGALIATAGLLLIIAAHSGHLFG